MSQRQAISIGFPSPIFINETATRQSILPGVYLNQLPPLNAALAVTTADLTSVAAAKVIVSGQL